MGEASPLENCEMCMHGKKEGQRVTDLLAMLFYNQSCYCIRLTKYSVNVKNGSLYYLIASCACVFHFPVCVYVTEASSMRCISKGCTVCVFTVNSLHFTDSPLLPSYMLYEEIAHPNDTARSTSG